MFGKSFLSLLNIWLGGAVFPGVDIPGIHLSLPLVHVALSGDLQVQIIASAFPPLLMQLSRLEGNVVKPLTTFPIYPKASGISSNVTAKIPCGYFSREGLYYIVVKKQPIGWKNSTYYDPEEDSLTSRSLDVRWPEAKLSISTENLETYPDHPVEVTLEYPEVKCLPEEENDAESSIPEFSLALYFCGDSVATCKTYSDQNLTQMVYSEKIRGFPNIRMFTLNCHLFGLAGYYAVFLKPASSSIDLSYTPAYIKANWSDQFVFNVHATSIFPCDVHSGGIPVLFEYPSCIRDVGDKIRLYAKLRANVASLDPPTTLEYVAEQRVVRGQHSVYFECDLFTERYVEYCFVYVSQAITGTMTNIRMDCVPTLPVTDQESGGWGPWSQWTPCTSTCFGGVRSRYRFCDSPPPRYGAKFCEGPAIESEKCGKEFTTSWNCFYGESLSLIKDMVAELPDVRAEVGSYCRCGCVVHVGAAKPSRLLATSSQSCPGRNFWLIQADADSLIEFRVLQFRLECRTQSLKIRDGNALSSNLLALLSSTSDAVSLSINSTGPNMLLEFFSMNIEDATTICGGGFLAQARQIKVSSVNVTAVPIAHNMGIIPIVILKLTAVHIAAIFFLSGLLLATIILGIQYIFRYRKYQIADGDDRDSLSNGSGVNIPLANRVSSSVTLLSEVISLTKFRPHLIKRNKHERLRESVDCDTLKAEEATLAKEESSSICSTTTITQDEIRSVSKTNEKSEDVDTSNSTLRRSLTDDSDKDKTDEKSTCTTPVDASPDSRRPSLISNATLTNVSLLTKIHSTSDPGCYSSGNSMVNQATIKSTSVKETKEKKNREKLLAGPTGSDFSISVHDSDLEMDYYDYNVVNAGAAPGSYLGMDPAFLVWIPPLDDDGEILSSYEHSEYHEMATVREYADPGSNQESPEVEVLLPTSRKPKGKSLDANEIDNKYISEKQPLVHKRIDDSDLDGLAKKLRESRKYIREDMEKETEVEKCLDLGNVDNIKFVDDEDAADFSGNQCNTDLAYHDSNAKSSS
ncbi:unnamed protein product [Phyllotreta striolata]|uniref:CUB domain-containing protein n=1 Tax=Phyllotreta striolata TaxID=444603 RepID=A0A9N9TWP3_PHYSR|nr:unnamed protein product [Phyllotreta striolata]